MHKSSFTNEVIVIQLNDHINAANAVALQKRFAEALSSPEYTSLLLDMTKVEALDSAGLMALVSTLTLAQRLDKHFSLFGVSPSVRIIFELTQLDRVFQITDTVPRFEAAIA